MALGLLFCYKMIIMIPTSHRGSPIPRPGEVGPASFLPIERFTSVLFLVPNPFHKLFARLGQPVKGGYRGYLALWGAPAPAIRPHEAHSGMVQGTPPLALPRNGVFGSRGQGVRWLGGPGLLPAPSLSDDDEWSGQPLLQFLGIFT